MNRKIKFRESFRPLAPIVLRECVDRYFEMRPQEDSPYMRLPSLAPYFLNRSGLFLSH